LFRRAAVLAACLAATVTAQTVVSPVAWTDVESNGGNAFPFGSSSVPYRYLNVHDDMVGRPGSIQSLALRRSGTTSTTVIPAFSVVLDTFLSSASTTGATVDATFANNHGPDLTQVTTNRTVNFPATGTGLLPYPFAYVIPFDTPFAFGGGGPLAWEVQILQRISQPSALFHDSVSGPSPNPSMVASRYGTGCVATGETDAFGLTGGSANQWTLGQLAMSATTRDGPPNGAALLLVGFDPTQWAGLPLPIQLPNTASGTSGPCYLQAPGIAQLPGNLSNSGSYTFRISTAATPLLNGVLLYSQAVALDLAANPFGIISTNGVNHQIVAPYGAQPGGRVYASSGLGATGIADAGQTLVVQFTY
jgi:hypothetical protein